MTFRLNRPPKESPSYTKPELRGYFSLNGANREYSPDLSQLRYFYKFANNERIHFDLNEGYNLVLRKPFDIAKRFDRLLQWIVENVDRISNTEPGSQRWLQPHFICLRGLLMKVCCTPHECEEGWIICAAKFKGTIYLSAIDTEKEKHRRTDRELRCSSWGFKFEQFIFSEAPGKRPDTSKPVNESEEFICLYSLQLDNNALFYGAEMDGVDSDVLLKEPISLKNLKFVEAKTQRRIDHPRHEYYFNRKLLRWWCQCFLAGIEDLVCGFRTVDGIVKELKNYHISRLNQMSQAWKPERCLNFMSDFLNYMKETVVEDCINCTYKFQWVPGSDVNMTIVPMTEYSVLPKWYIEKATELLKQKNVADKPNMLK